MNLKQVSLGSGLHKDLATDIIVSVGCSTDIIVGAGCSVGGTKSIFMNLKQVSSGSGHQKGLATDIVVSVVCPLLGDNFGGTVRPRELGSEPL